MSAPRTLFAMIAVATLVVGCRASSTPATCEPMAVHPVRFVGNGALTADELRVPFQSLERMQLPWPTLVTTAFADALSIATRDLTDMFVDRGWLDATVRDVTYVPSSDRRWIDVTVTIEEGKRYKVGAISLRDTGGPPLVDPDATVAAFPAKKGDWYSKRTMDVGMSAILGAYADRGVGARASAIGSSDGNDSVDVVIEIQRQPAIDRVAKIEVYGVTEKREAAVAASLGLRIGDRVDPARLRDAKGRAMASGDFAAVEIHSYPLDGGRPGEREIEVVVSELSPTPP